VIRDLGQSTGLEARVTGETRGERFSGPEHRIGRVRKFILTAGVLLLVGLSSLAQNTEPAPAPGEVVLNFSTDGEQHTFHLGELIPIRFSYVATRPNTFILVSQNQKLNGGRGFEVACSPPAETVRRVPLPSDGGNKFDEMLAAPCGGVGGGVGGGCFDCDAEYLLSASPISFAGIALNTYARFRTPGKYSCIASSADVTTAPRDEKFRSALLVKSKPFDLTIVDDPGWAHSAAMAYADAYQKFCRADDVPEHRFLQCSDFAARLVYLDTPESLATKVRFFGGVNRWENGFWDAIQSTSYPDEALRLMTRRMQDPDVEVSTLILKYLAALDLKLASPDAFQGAPPASYHVQAVEKMRKYVRLLGGSLANKNSDVLPDSAKAYRTLAEQKHCEEQPLIPEEEQTQALVAAGIGP